MAGGSRRSRAGAWRRPGRLAGAALAVVLAALTGFAGSAAAEGPAPEYGIRAALTGRTTLEHNHFAYALAPGGTVRDAVIVSNFTGSALRFRVYGADTVGAQGGGLAPAPDGVPPTGAGRWIEVTHPEVTIPAHREVSDEFTVRAPADAAPGDEVGAMVVEPETASSGGIRVVSRGALLVRVTIVGVAHAALTVGPLHGARGPGGESFTLPVVNGGNVLLTITGEVTVRDGGGNTLAEVPLSPRDVYVIPGGRTALGGTWGAPPMWGSVTAVATVRATRDGRPAGTFSSTTLRISFLPGTALVIAAVAAVALAVLAATGAVLAGRRRRSVCSHCRRGFPGRALLDVTDVDEVAGCSRCLDAIRVQGRVRLCAACVRHHLGARRAVERPAVPGR